MGWNKKQLGNIAESFMNKSFKQILSQFSYGVDVPNQRKPKLLKNKWEKKLRRRWKWKKKPSGDGSKTQCRAGYDVI